MLVAEKQTVRCLPRSDVVWLGASGARLRQAPSILRAPRGHREDRRGDSSGSSNQRKHQGGGPRQHHGGRIWRESSIDFWTEGRAQCRRRRRRRRRREYQQRGFQSCRVGKQQTTVEEDPPSKLSGQFLHKQRASGGGLSLDMDLEMDERRKQDLPPLAESPEELSYSKELKVSFPTSGAGRPREPRRFGSEAIQGLDRRGTTS
ncbi:hypothetical protein M0R45_009831 [Rubus argutus]|uniref:Uncharacterized protein n=1 Tax=Rubus argutus TaxID=59490 RepID=A0AAW1Y5U5_RUBAR